MKVIIAGGREFNNYELLKSSCDRILIRQSNIEIVSGKALGADKLGEDYAKEKGYKIKEFPADWIKYKKGAGPIRNKQMAEYADGLIAFWDGQSKGTKNMKSIIEVRAGQSVPTEARFIMPGRSQNVYTNVWGKIVKEQDATFFYEVISEENNETPNQAASHLLKDFVKNLVDGDQLKVIAQVPPNTTNECVLLLNPRDNNMLTCVKGIND